MSNKLLVPVIIATSLVCFAFVPQKAKKPWAVPDKNAKMANPVKADAAAVNNGKALYAKHCQSCHGKKGIGDGPKSGELKTEPGDFSSSAFQAQSDGSIFYKVSEGRDDMPSFKKKIQDPEEIWSIIQYVRTLKK
jgi:mono/diheme cytochrome c family protein